MKIKDLRDFIDRECRIDVAIVVNVTEGKSSKGSKYLSLTLQDSTGTMAYLQLEAMDIEHVAVKKAVAYIDHNMLQTGFENMDDHEFIRSVAKKHGIIFSRPGNGVCHQLHLENFSKPGETLVGSDSHTPTCGAMGMIAIGAGGLDVAIAMAKGQYYLTCPSVIQVELVGSKPKWVSAKDIILKILQILTVKGGVNKIVEYCGEGIKSLSLTDRATICNMGAELGATTSIFPTDEKTKEYLIQQGRLDDYKELGSVCSGGRYNDLASFYTDKVLPGVGISIGLTRLFYVFKELGIIKTTKKCTSDVMVLSLGEDYAAFALATKLKSSANFNSSF